MPKEKGTRVIVHNLGGRPAMRAVFEHYLLPGLIFMAVVVGGGYATGRELIEFFYAAGPWGGLLGMSVAAVVWSAVLAVSFEFARITQSYDYTSFMHSLLGPGWVVFEILYLALLVLVMAVIGSAAGHVVDKAIGLPALYGTLLLVALIAVLVYFGNALIEKLLGGFALVLCATYFVIVVWSGVNFGDDIAATFASEPIGSDWLQRGIRYAGYNTAVLPAVLFCLRRQTRRRETIVSGLIAGPLGILPGVLLFVAMMGRHPEIGEEAVPLAYLISNFDAPWFAAAFSAVFFGVLVKTGTALLHSINERVAARYERRAQQMPRLHRSILSIAVLLMSIFAASSFGLVNLIAKGYGSMTYLFLVILVLPVLTVGVWRVVRFRAIPIATSG